LVAGGELEIGAKFVVVVENFAVGWDVEYIVVLAEVDNDILQEVH
jgi:hypothetical protein